MNAELEALRDFVLRSHAASEARVEGMLAELGEIRSQMREEAVQVQHWNDDGGAFVPTQYLTAGELR